MALNYNPKATVNKETICNWTFTPDGEDPTTLMKLILMEYTDVNYNGGVDPTNVNDGFVGSDFHYAQKFTVELDQYLVLLTMLLMHLLRC